MKLGLELKCIRMGISYTSNGKSKQRRIKLMHFMPLLLLLCTFRLICKELLRL